MKSDQLAALIIAAARVAADAPERYSAIGFQTFVRRDHVDELRAALEAVGVQWRPMCRENHPRSIRKGASENEPQS